MPAKVKITKEAIVKSATELIRKKGEKGINARAIASALKCSTQPIFSNFATMDELMRAVIAYAYEKYLEFLNKEAEENQYSKYKSFGMAYIRFAKEEKELFKLLFMRDRKGEELIPSDDFNLSVETIMSTNNLPKETATLIHWEMWICVHGIATMFATSFLSIEWEFISKILSDMYQGIMIKYLPKEK